MPRKKKAAAISVVLVLIFCLGLSFLVVGASMQSVRDEISPSAKLFGIGLYLFVGIYTPKDPAKSLSDIERQREINKNYRVADADKAWYGFTTNMFDGFEVCYFGDENAPLTVLYLHGGTFMYQPTAFHFAYCALLAESLSARVILPVYPKSPEYQYGFTTAYLVSFYQSLLAKTDADNIIFMGDSAGGSLVISLSQRLYDEEVTLPKRLVAFSPCIDLRLDNPVIPVSDVYLNKKNLQIKFEPYVGTAENYFDPWANPAFVDYRVLPPLDIFTGGAEILAPDASALFLRLSAEGINNVRYYEFKALYHNFAMFPIVERQQVLNIIKASL